jgi:predicted heme/steroid binding protein
MKILYIIILLISASFIVSGCGTTTPEQSSSAALSSNPSSSFESTSTDENQTTGTNEEETLRVFTLIELSEYDGKEGRKAYVAVNGLVYDVTDVSAWSGGTHFRNIAAGKDLTEVIENDSPHGLRVLDNLTVVGKFEN